MLPGSALAADSLVAELEQRLASAGVESVNDADKLLRAMAQGQACRAAHLFELENARVTLRVASPSPAPPERQRS